MSLNDSLKKMIFAYYKRDDESFGRAIREIVSIKISKGHNNVARELEDVLRDAIGSPSLLNMKQLKQLPPPPIAWGKIPVSSEEGIPLLKKKSPSMEWEDLVLQPDVLARLENICQEQENSEKLIEYGKLPKSNILFYGPPGCGKTLSAHVLSGALGWPILIVRFDSVVSSLLGSTSHHLRKIFDYASQNPCILFFDEFDVVGHSRDTSDVGEMKRVASFILQLMDEYDGDGIIISATNYEGGLDKALWSRFDDVIQFGKPDLIRIRRLLKMSFNSFDSDIDFDVSNSITKFEGLSCREIVKICDSSIVKSILSDQNKVGEDELIHAYDLFVEHRSSVSI